MTITINFIKKKKLEDDKIKETSFKNKEITNTDIVSEAFENLKNNIITNDLLNYLQMNNIKLLYFNQIIHFVGQKTEKNLSLEFLFDYANYINISSIDTTFDFVNKASINM